MEINIFKNPTKLLNLPRSIKALFAISIDLTCCIFSVWFAYYLRLGNLISFSDRGWEALGYALIISFPIFLIFGIYKNIFRYSGLNSLISVSKAISLHGIIYGTRISIFGIEGIPRTIGLIEPLLLFFLIISWRILARFLLRNLTKKNYAKKEVIKALVYGSGDAGRQLVKAMQDSKDISIKGFLDDD